MWYSDWYRVWRETRSRNKQIKEKKKKKKMWDTREIQ